MDLRMTCLQERLSGLRALTNVFSEANGSVVENAVSAANALGSLDRCADLPLLRAVVRPPEDAALRGRVANLRERLAAMKARFDSGKWKEGVSEAPSLVAEARSLDYKPLLAEALAHYGAMLGRSNHPDMRRTEKILAEAFLVADTSRHDEVRAEVATNLVYVTGSQQAELTEAKRWAESAQAVLGRIGGHELLQSWLFNDLCAVYVLHGETEAALDAARKAITLKEKALGQDHPDVALSVENLAIALAEAGNHEEALVQANRAIALLEKGLGTGHPDLGGALNNRGEVLNALGRYHDARASFERARAIWERELGPDGLSLAYVLTGIGNSYLGEGEPGSALVPLERALQIREVHESDPGKLSETRFALARALWDSRRDRGRAGSLAEDARRGYLKVTLKNRVAEVERWLETHQTERSSSR
jgi:tetratricopeptide (TPR) repeat protein